MVLEKLKLSGKDPKLKERLLESMCSFSIEAIGRHDNIYGRLDRYIVKKLASNTRINIGAPSGDDTKEKK